MTYLLRILLVLPLVCGCQAGQPVESGNAAPIPKVATLKVARKSLQRTTTQPGEIQGFEAAPLYAKASGYVEKVHVDLGDAVKEGDLLVTLFIPEVQEELKARAAQLAVAESGLVQAKAAVKVAEAAVKSAEARCYEAEAAVDRAEAEYQKWKSESERIGQLVERGAVTTKLLDETRSQFRAADATRKAAAAGVDSAEAGVTQSKAMLESAQADEQAAHSRIQLAKAELDQKKALAAYSKIHAPFAGQIAARNIDTGHLVSAAATSGNKPVLSVVRADVVRVFCNVPELDAGLTDPGDQAKITIQASANLTIDGQVTRTAAALNDSTRTLRTEIDLPNPNGRLKPGMYANVTITIAERTDVLAVPTSAVFTHEGKPACAVVANGHVVLKNIEIGLQAGSEVEVTSGLDSGDEVIPKGAGGFAPGQTVEGLPPEAKK